MVLLIGGMIVVFLAGMVAGAALSIVSDDYEVKKETAV